MCCAAKAAAPIRSAYNSCRNRHCPKCQSTAAQRWLDARQADLLPVEYYHVVFTLPAPIADLAYQNKAAIYGLLFDVAAEVLQTIAADPKHLGARIGATLVLHTWGSALTHHPHVHGIVPGGGLSPDGNPVGRLPAGVLPAGARAVPAVPAALPGRTAAACTRPASCGSSASTPAWPTRGVQDLAGADAPVRVGGLCQATVRRALKAVLAYLSRYTHRVAISNSRLLAMDERGVTFRWKDYRAKGRRATRR
jgi:hypothetical protein